jgi:hypothetical protein
VEWLAVTRAERLAETQVERPAETQVERLAEAQADRPVEAQVDRPVGVQAEQQAEARSTPESVLSASTGPRGAEPDAAAVAPTWFRSASRA